MVIIKNILRKHKWILIILLFSFLMIIGGAFLFIRSAFKTAELVQKKEDSVRTLIYEKETTKFITQYKPKEVFIHDTITKIVKTTEYSVTENDTEETLKAKLNKLNSKYFSSRIFQDSLKLKDKRDSIVALINIQDSISENEIKGRSINYSLFLPKETLTITKTLIQPNKRIFHIGPELTYTKLNPFNSIGLGIIYQDRKNNLFKLSSGIQQTQTYFGLGLYKKL